MKLISRADVVLALGTRLGPFGTLPQHGLDYWPQNAKIIQVDADPRMLGLVKKISVGICGDAKAAAVELLERLKAQRSCSRNKARLAEVQKEKEAWKDELANWPSPERERPHRSAPGAGRARESDAEERDGLHRHRQRVLGRRTAICISRPRRRSSPR